MLINPSRSRVLITGGAGFIGTHLAEALSADRDVVLFDCFRHDSLALAPHLSENPHITVLSGDVLDKRAVRDAMEGVETVLHLAAIAGVSSYYSQPLRTLEVNILGTVNTLEAASEEGVRQFVYFSSSEVFGANALWVGEGDPCGIGPVTDPRWVYATSKLAGENFVFRHAETDGFCGVVIRPFNIYGPRQVGEGAISNFCRAAATGKPLTVYGDGSAIRAWCYVSDLVAAVQAALDLPQTQCHVFNIGNPREIETTAGLARRVAQLAPGTEVEFEDTDRAEIRVRVPVIDTARAVLGFEPVVSLDEGLQQTLTWFKSQQEG